MSAKITLGSTLGGLVLLIIIGVVVITGSKANEEAAIAAKEQSIQNNKDIDYINQTVNDFVDRWEKRVQVSNEINNKSRELEREQTANIIGNLSAHRIITNMSDSNQTLILEKVLNQTAALTSDEYKKLSDIRVNNIIGNLSADHEVIMRALNITNKDNSTDSEDITQKILEYLEKGLPAGKLKNK